ncbi:hypothetical protein [Solibacillus sp. FSL W8-0372]|uniref:hypothetical protein n=1 Tax=Solibacillus sp. FSL W8-0372 TaxID=2921713 RepID=UPI0030D2DFB8
MDDVNTLADKDASLLDKGIAGASFLPIGKVLKIQKVFGMKQRNKKVVKELSATVPTVDDVKEERNGFLNSLGDIGSGTTKVEKILFDFLKLLGKRL